MLRSSCTWKKVERRRPLVRQVAIPDSGGREPEPARCVATEMASDEGAASFALFIDYLAPSTLVIVVTHGQSDYRSARDVGLRDAFESIGSTQDCACETPTHCNCLHHPQ